MRIQTRLILTLSLMALAVVLGIVLLFQWRFESGMVDYVNAQQRERLQVLAVDLAERWQADPGWQSLREDPHEFRKMVRHAGQPHDTRTDEDDDDEHDDHRAGPPPRPVVLLDAQHEVLIGRVPRGSTLSLEVPVQVDGRTVGFLGTPRFLAIEADIDRHFRSQQLQALWLVGAFALALAIAVAVLLARSFTRPLERLSRAAHRLTQQQYDVDVDAERRDELGALARDIRELATTLSRNADLRQRWFADVSHELRTPLSVLLGEIDALLDGVRPLTPERIESLRQETVHLQRLVDDLYVLARADLGALQYRKEPVDLAELVRERIDAAGPAVEAAGLTLHLELPVTGPVVDGDVHRLQQLVDNLLANSARYTDRGGRLQVAIASRGREAQLVIEDSAPGVPDAALARLFDHLYRVDEARTRSAGGAGLGLAICRRIVEAHGGRIEAAHSALGGLRITVCLPLATEEA